MATPPITTKFVFEVDHASIQFKMGDEVVTEYVLENNVVSVPAISDPVETDVDSHRSSLNELSIWAEFAADHVDVTSSVPSPFKLELENSVGTFQMKFQVETSLLTDATYNKSSKLITWQPHPVAVLAWSDFQRWLRVLTDFSQTLREVG